MFLSPYTASTKADANHQEQNFGTCGHHLTIAECSAYGARVLADPAYLAYVEDSDDKPYGCYKIPATPAYNFNNNKYHMKIDPSQVKFLRPQFYR